MVSMRKIFIGFILLFIGVFPAFAGKTQDCTSFFF